MNITVTSLGSPPNKLTSQFLPEVFNAPFDCCTNNSVKLFIKIKAPEACGNSYNGSIVPKDKLNQLPASKTLTVNSST